ncbi:MAG: hypothetical protein HY554_06095 [Elusimicrobia bacterium]|nr:hypothetical protein [Elusimicrobiota bacterium]
MRAIGAAAALGLALLSSGCGILYTNIRVPRAYRSATPSEVRSETADPTVAGEACNHAVLYLVAWGDGGYAAATKAALASAPEGVLYDVRVDQKVTSVLLGLYARACTVVSARVAKR